MNGSETRLRCLPSQGLELRGGHQTKRIVKPIFQLALGEGGGGQHIIITVGLLLSFFSDTRVQIQKLVAAM